MDINHLLQYLERNWFQLAIDFVAGINVVVAGAKAMGWDKLANECTRIENAIAAMVQAALNRGGVNAQKISDSTVVNGSPNDKPSSNIK